MDDLYFKALNKPCLVVTISLVYLEIINFFSHNLIVRPYCCKHHMLGQRTWNTSSLLTSSTIPENALQALGRGSDQ